jgi:tetratricopeptide (TPR) repeat protein
MPDSWRCVVGVRDSQKCAKAYAGGVVAKAIVGAGWTARLLATCVGGLFWSSIMMADRPAHAQQACEIDRAQELFGRQPRPVEAVEAILDHCSRTDSTDFRIPLFQGVIAREIGHRNEAIRLLEIAHDRAPRENVVRLELAFSLEQSHPHRAAHLYDEVIADDATSRAARLGLARLARTMLELDKARAIYARMLEADPKDVDALNGMAWIALVERDRAGARAGFEGVLALQPQNAEAQIGMNRMGDAWRYRLEAGGSFVGNGSGQSWGGGASLLVALNPTDKLELGEFHYTNELPSVSLAGRTVLPSDDIRLGYYRQVPDKYNWSLTYDFRNHSAAPSEHWIEPGGGFYVSDTIQLFAAYRQSFGAPQWDNRLLRAGAIAALADSWDVVATGYAAAQHDYNDYQPIFSWSLDVNYRWLGDGLLNFGFGYSPLLSNVDLHARAVLPLTQRLGAILSVAHVSVNDDTRASVGLRFSW